MRSAHVVLSRTTLAFVIASLVSLAHAQTQASCTFKLFALNPANPSAPLTNVNGVNDYSIVVGQAAENWGNGVTAKAFVRLSTGSVSYYSPSNSISSQFYARNDNGVMVGDYADTSFHSHAFIKQGSTVTPISDPKASPYSTIVRGINKYVTTVGGYTDANGILHGFERSAAGVFTTLSYPLNGVPETDPNGINDNNVVVGSYVAPDGSLHGFVYHGGQWATLDYPQTTGTELFGISNAGVIIGIDHSTEQGRAFMYVNKTFKVISVPNSFATEATGIAPGGLIAGRTNLDGTQNGWRGFTATCH